MTLPVSPPKFDSWADMASAIRLGDKGWRAYAVQCMVATIADGTFGKRTEDAVKAWQRDNGLTPDGVVGPATQTTMLELAGIRADRAHSLPEGVGYGYAVGEGANMLAATNWQVPGGVDCGPAQWRISGPPYDLPSMKFAFNARTALDGALERLVAYRDEFKIRNKWLRNEPQHVLRVAVLNHNWPAGADSIVRKYKGDGRWWRYVGSPDEPATWVQGFTRAQWAKEYPARILRFVAGP